ncbi:MAG: hypothetical protein Q9159_003032 [Coniocarpon cinnabarinum]
MADEDGAFQGVFVPPPPNENDYEYVPLSTVVNKVVQEIDHGSGQLQCQIRFDDDHQDILDFQTILELEGGPEALHAYENPEEEEIEEISSDDAPPLRRRPARSGSRRQSNNLSLISSDDELAAPSSRTSSTRPTRKRKAVNTSSRSLRSSGGRRGFYELKASSTESDDEEESGRRASRRQKELKKRAREQEAFEMEESEESDEADDIDLLTSDVLPKKRKRESMRSVVRQSGRPSSSVNGIRFEKARKSGIRASDRATRARGNMQEADVNDIFRSDSEDDRRPAAPKITVTREKFQDMSRTHPFARRHMQQCDTCGNRAGAQGPLVYCQGCSLAYHKPCLGHRTNREHLVTKVDDDEFVLQCRRCVNLARRKDPAAPDQAMCQSCRDTGPACKPFRKRKTPVQEEREREENDGVDPVAPVGTKLINNPDNVLFRCVRCWRAFHYHHLASKSDAMDIGTDDDVLADERLREFGYDWTCKECATAPAKIAGLVAWRPVDLEFDMDLDGTEVSEDAKEYLIKWENKSYFRALWMPGAWTWGVTAVAMRKAFAKRIDGTNLPVRTTEEAIPEDYLRIDIIFDVKFTSIVDTRAEEVDKARIKEVDSALTKYKGLGYEDVVWEKVPTPDDGERWTDFVRAYDDWVMGRYVRIPKPSNLKPRLEKARAQDFEKLEKHEQPKNLVGGDLMKYQIQGINWLYYRWYLQTTGILADEMGLGKTIQIIGLLATLVEDHNCFPFLIVVPNSTCPNWRREIKQWAPSLRVVTYFGSSTARRLAYEHELFPEGSKTLKAHVVVTSYEAAADDSSRRFFKSVPWQGLIVDEGQRLKSDRTNLYGALSQLKIQYIVLLTGTPLQNNPRELFNLLQFLDANFNAEELELEYSELTKENIPQLHNMIRPFFLRRTKAEVLTFLPPMGQIIVPVSMSVLQKKLYKSILAKNGDLIKAIFSEKAVAKAERTNLSNILMQLRKCLCHPFVYSQDIEERVTDHGLSHRNLVEAGSKLELLSILLPKLKARGHRVLIFSQFLNMLDIIEDFLNGMGMMFERLDGTISAMQKQKRIDKFNAPDSELFAFLLSTRAGGIGINLATADTVIILDPDFNPHQDIQALSRAHRIGQKKKVLCFQLMTRASAEEKIVQIGRRKMALDHVLIDQMDAEDDSNLDLESIIKHGAAELLEEDSTKELKYDSESVEKLLDRSQIEESKTGEDQSAESQFSFARVWANDNESLADSIEESDGEARAPDPGVWEKILQERERAAAEEAVCRQQALGRGKRARQTIDYTAGDQQQPGETPSKGRGRHKDESSDTDFQAEDSDKDKTDEEELEEEEGARDAAAELAGAPEKSTPKPARTTSSQAAPAPPRAPPSKPKTAPRFRRSNIEWPSDPAQLPTLATPEDVANPPPVVQCIACNTSHRRGYCPLKIAGAEICNLCGVAHYGVARTCPHIRSETQVRTMLQALKRSPEDRQLVQEATKYLSGVRGTLAQSKRQKAARQEAEMQAVKNRQFMAAPASSGFRRMSGTAPRPPGGYPPYPGVSGGAPFGSAGILGPGNIDFMNSNPTATPGVGESAGGQLGQAQRNGQMGGLTG